jgi:hypothetical protein
MYLVISVILLIFFLILYFIYIINKEKRENKDYFQLSLRENTNAFDIIIPIGPNDKNIIYKQIEYTKQIS